MVDDIATIVKCDSIEGINVNVKNENFVKSKKLEFQTARGKCSYVHIGEGECTSKYYAHEKSIDKSNQSKYLGDMISNNIDDLYDNRAEKANGSVAMCLGMATEISLGFHLYPTAKMLHEAIFVNGTILNMETWTNCTDQRIEEFDRKEQNYFRKILNAHSKTTI